MSRIKKIAASLMLAVLIVANLGVSIAGAADGERSISFYADFTGIGVARGQDINLYINLANTGEIGEDIELTMAAPEDWDASIVSNAVGGAQVRSLHLEPEGGSQRLTLRCTP
ncbi:MAG: hypothetical protein HOC20_06320, partial [Chloroflexi bacterium]|nr:hypothetical protein [Chloroflexota bacterium]